jgi:hypothetical protein
MSINPWDIVKKIFNAQEMDEEEKNFSVNLINRIFSYNKDLMKDCDKLNRLFPLNQEQWYKLFVVCFSGKSRYLDYLRKQQVNEDKVMEKFVTRICKLYRWSRREFFENVKTMGRIGLLNQLIFYVGLSNEEQKHIKEEITNFL